jgi:5-methylcytosine-specific restriction protein A
MSWYYRELAGDREFRCAECGRKKKVKYVPVSNLCRSCAAEKAAKKRSSLNTLVSIPSPSTIKKTNRDSNIDKTPFKGIPEVENTIVTKAIEKRMRKMAEDEIPLSQAEKRGEAISRWGTLFFWASGYFVARAVSNAFFPYEEFTALFWIVLMAWCFGLPWANMVIVDKIIAKPHAERLMRIHLRIIDLAEERRKRLAESIRFYSSPEWAKIRKQVIEEDGPICSECRKHIKETFDLTVDHKKPRGNYPKLALSRDNLRVLCRKCNSEKGSDDWIDELVQNGELKK